MIGIEVCEDIDLLNGFKNKKTIFKYEILTSNLFVPDDADNGYGRKLGQ
jgi:hypothetical protein